jgi:hypothetical protein
LQVMSAYPRRARVATEVADWKESRHGGN